MASTRRGTRLALPGAAVALALGLASAGLAQQAGPPPVPPSGGHTATALTDGTVLVVSGSDASLFHPREGSWTAAASPAVPRSGHAAVLLPNGNVLVTGGYPDSVASAAVETFDPAAGTWKPARPMPLARFDHTLTVLDDGSVLVAGGRAAGHGPFLANAERYDPATDTWRPTGSMPLGRAFHTATKLADGRVLVTGGQSTPHDKSLRDAVLFDPSKDTWTAVHQLMSVNRARHTAALLPDGTVLIAGGTRQREGQQAADLETSAEVYDPQTDSFTPTASLHVGRAGQGVVSLPGGVVLVVAGEQTTSGDTPETAVASAELYEPATRQWRQLASPGRGAMSATATLLVGNCDPHCGEVLVVDAAGALLYSVTNSSHRVSRGGSHGSTTALLVLLAVLVSATGVGALLLRRRRERSANRRPPSVRDRSPARS